MKHIIAGGLIVAGMVIEGWAAISALQPAAIPYELNMSQASPDALPQSPGLSVEAGKLDRLEVRVTGLKKPIVTAIVMHDREGRLVPLIWSNAVTEPVFFPDLAPTEALKVLTAIKEHVPSEAIILSWWDLSRRIRSLTQRQAPLDDPLARGLLTPRAWSASQERVRERQRVLWGEGVPAGDAGLFARFIDALLLDEEHGVEALASIAEHKPAYIAVHLSDIWKAAAARPDLISIAYRDFPAASGPHGTIPAVREWVREQKIEGGYAVEPIGSAIRVHYLPRKSDSDLLLARLLPFSTSNPFGLGRLRLVYQNGGYWIYELRV